MRKRRALIIVAALLLAAAVTAYHYAIPITQEDAIHIAKKALRQRPLYITQYSWDDPSVELVTIDRDMNTKYFASPLKARERMRGITRGINLRGKTVYVVTFPTRGTMGPLHVYIDYRTGELYGCWPTEG